MKSYEFSRYRRTSGTKPRVLIADDEAVTRTLLLRSLNSWGYSVEVARDGQQAWNILSKKDGPSLAILDWMMPEMDGPTLCKKVRNIDERYVYVIVLSARAEKEDLVEGLEAGADDYVVKPFQLDELRARLRCGARILELEEELRTRATRDVLTGLWSRQAILEMFTRELARSRRAAKPLTALLIDLDHFKKVNDQHGHPVGDFALAESARRIVSAVRAYDPVGRYGGEEILVLLPECTAQAGKLIAERIRTTVAADPIAPPGIKLALTVSIGGATGDGGKSTPAELLEQADAALYRAKAGGRNQVQFSPQI